MPDQQRESTQAQVFEHAAHAQVFEHAAHAQASERIARWRDFARDAHSEDRQGADEHSHSALAPAKISLLYESRDGRLCLFEDGAGHLTAVPSCLLA